MRRAPLGLLLVVALAGCGKRERTPALAPVRVALTAPEDLAEVEAPTVTVRGHVTPPGARVLVDGVEATQRGGEFSAEVDLRGGANLIDVQASAPRHPAAFAAVRVTRLVPVEVPKLEGLSPGDATERLQVLGLGAEVRKVNPIDFLLPGTVGVCGTEPEEGAKVRTGSSVTLLVQKSC
jgi:Glucodextranase, domain B/PASTA domain